MSQAKPQPKTRAVNAEVEINAPIAAVWKALTAAEELTRWFPLFDYRNVNFYLFTYGVPKQQVEAIESRTRLLLQGLEG